MSQNNYFDYLNSSCIHKKSKEKILFFVKGQYADRNGRAALDKSSY